MKKIIMAAFLIFSLGATAQRSDDQLQQQPPRETEVQVEKAAARDAKKTEAEKKADAKQREKEAEERNATIKKDEEEKDKANSKAKK